MPSTLSLKKRLLTLTSFFLFIIVSLSSGWAAESSDLVVYFDTNGRDLNVRDQNILKKIFKTVDLVPETKILVVGYTDSTGATNTNYALSRQRANTVKNFLLAHLKLDASKIIAVGRGSESPVAANDSSKNKARNRRAEIFILGKPGSIIISKRPSFPPPPPDPEAYMDLLKKAQRLVKIGAWDKALIILEKAQSKGAKHHSLWHLLFGIIGYYQAVDTNILRSYFERALQLDSQSLDALDFLGRTKARQDFESGLILADSGRSAATAIKVETISQQYEFMRLFGVEPLERRRLPNLPIDVWQCRTSNMTTIEYYFDISSAYQWAFAPNYRDKSAVDGNGK